MNLQYDPATLPAEIQLEECTPEDAEVVFRLFLDTARNEGIALRAEWQSSLTGRRLIFIHDWADMG